MSEDRQNQDSGNGATRRVPINLGLLHPIGTPQVTPVHALAPGAQSLGSLTIQPPRQDSLFPANDTGVQYLSQGPIGSPTVPVGQSIDPALMNIPGTGAHAAYQANLERAANVALSFGPGRFRAYHGTGATPFEQFLDEFVGTGEGAQAYSWGHYVAGSPGVAKSYVPPELAGPTLGGKDWLPGGPNPAMDLAQHQMMMNNGDIDKAIANTRAHADLLDSLGGDPSTARYRSAANFLEQNKDRIGWDKTRGGSMLNVWVKPDHEEFLDWDLAHHEQEPGVQDKLSALGDKIGADEWWPSGRTGREIYKDIGRFIGPNGTAEGRELVRPYEYQPYLQAQSKVLNDAGIPGMRFLDQQSRGLPEGHPDRTYNYVVYDPKNIEITHRDGERVHTLEPVDHDPWAEQKAVP